VAAFVIEAAESLIHSPPTTNIVRSLGDCGGELMTRVCHSNVEAAGNLAPQPRAGLVTAGGYDLWHTTAVAAACLITVVTRQFAGQFMARAGHVSDRRRARKPRLTQRNRRRRRRPRAAPSLVK